MTSPFVVSDQNSSNFRFSAEMAEKRTALLGRVSEVSSGQHGSRSSAGVCSAFALRSELKDQNLSPQLVLAKTMQ